MKKTASWMLMIGMTAVTGFAELADIFDKWDTDKSGDISKEEFIAMTKFQFEKQGEDNYLEVANKRFTNRDVNKDGVLSREEFCSEPGKQPTVILG